MTHRSAGAARWGALLGLALILALAGWLRFSGSSWGELQHQHPDENHLSSVADRLRAKVCGDPTREVDTCPPEQRRWIGVRHYFRTSVSTLNPYNRGFSFYVYGNLPLTIVRVVADATGVTDMRQLGRWLSAAADVVAVLWLYVLAAHLYGRRVALLASLFSALAVLQIQQSHFFTVDTFVNVFALPALYFAVRLSGVGQADTARKGTIGPGDVVLSIAFGLALGMALASKLIVYPMALVLPAALLARRSWSRGSGSLPPPSWSGLAICLAAGAVATAVSFRVFQPYAFLGWGLNPQWLANLEELQRLASPANDVPWNLQWARRSHWFSFYNLTWWGLGLPIAPAAWAGLALMAWRIVRGQRVHALLWAWTLGFFVWQSLQFNPTLRYQLPVYPLLALAAAWFVVEAARWRRAIGVTLGLAVTLLAAIWAFAFQSIYLRDEPRIAASRWIFQHVPGPATLEIVAGDGTRYRQPLALPRDADAPDAVTFRFAAVRSGELANVLLPRVRTAGSRVDAVLSAPPGPVAAGASADVPPAQDGDTRGPSVRLAFEEPPRVEQGSLYELTVRADAAPLELSGATIANETDYDYSLPFRIDGYDPFGGIYPGDLNLQVYWDDNEAKRDRLVDMLSRADYVFIPTNHQYAQITRLPERYPLTTHYYRELLGCPDGLDTIECYRRADPGVFEGRLGFELAAVFDNPPRLGPLVIDDQAAEEAFTFYDHPTVLIFRKSGDFSVDRVRASLSAVDTTRAVRLTPKDFEGFSTLLLPRDDAARQRAGGTWSALFDYDALQNRYPWLAAVSWYALLTVLGLAVWPWLRLALPSLPDHGYPMARFAGLLIAGYLAWLWASIGGTYSRTSIAVVVGALLACGAALAWRDRAAIRGEWRERRRDLLTVEALGLALFVAGLLLRVANPDLWHPARGGERPMDFSYLNAVIRSTTFPPYDPWFAGGYINYYYFGFVLVATPIKLLGIVPAIAYNLALPTLLAMVGLGAFSLGWNLQALDRRGRTACLLGGLATTAFTVLIGNLGTVRLVVTKLVEGGWAQVTATPPGEWFWRPSRMMPPGPGNEITEFPLFTFIYGDLHAHMMALPLALAVLTLSLAAVAIRDRRPRPASLLAFLLLFALVVGALYPTNMADAYTYPAIAALAVVYAVWRKRSGPDRPPRDAGGGRVSVSCCAGVDPVSAVPRCLPPGLQRGDVVDGSAHAARLLPAALGRLSLPGGRLARDRGTTQAERRPHVRAAALRPSHDGGRAARHADGRVRRGAGGHRAAEHRLQVLSPGVDPAGGVGRRRARVDGAARAALATARPHGVDHHGGDADRRRGALHRHRDRRQGSRPLASRSPAHARRDDVHAARAPRGFRHAHGPRRGLPRDPLAPGPRAGLPRDRRGALFGVPLVLADDHLHRAARCRRLELPPASAAGPDDDVGDGPRRRDRHLLPDHGSRGRTALSRHL